MKPQRKAEIRAAAAAATPGPWRTDRTGKTVSGFTCDIVIAAVAPRQAIYCTPEGGTFPEADRRFIALSREAVPELLAQVDRLEAALADCRDNIQSAGEAMLDGRLKESADWLVAAQDVAIEAVGPAPADEEVPA